MTKLSPWKNLVPKIAVLCGITALGFFSYSWHPITASFFFGISAALTLFLVLHFIKSKPNTGDGDTAATVTSELAQIVESADLLDEGVIVYNSNQKAILVNSRLKQIFANVGVDISVGVTRNELSQHIAGWFKNSTELQRIQDYVKSVSGTSNEGNHELKIKMPDGQHVVYREKSIAGNGIVSSVREITEDVHKQQELIETHTMLSAVYETIPIGICIYNSDNCVVGWNEKYLEVMEIDPSTIYKGIQLRQHLLNDFHRYSDVGDDPDAFADSVIEQVRTIKTQNIERRFKNGKIIEISRAYLPGGGYMSTFTDLTLEKATQKLLKESENRYRKMVELSPDAILVHKDSIIIYANAAAIHLLEARDLHSIVGDRIQKYFPVADHDLLNAHFGPADHLQQGQIVPTERSQVIGRIGNRINVELEASALLYGEKPVMQIIARDISAQTRAQELLEKAKEEAESAAQLKGTFLANMSHELRTPLNAVIGFSEIIKNEYYGKVGSPKYIEYATDIHNSGVHLLDLINEILDLSKIESGAQEIYEEQLNIGSIVEECIRLTGPQREKAKVTITSHLSSVLPNIVADNKMIKQVVLNLLSNAIKFTPSGGKIDVSCIVQRNGGLALSVEDTGIGIREEDIEKALTPFVQVDSEFNRKYQGTGLGLPLSKNLMELHGGSLEVTSDFGSGTTVTVYLPSERVELTAA